MVQKGFPSKAFQVSKSCAQWRIFMLEIKNHVEPVISSNFGKFRGRKLNPLDKIVQGNAINSDLTTHVFSDRQSIADARFSDNQFRFGGIHLEFATQIGDVNAQVADSVVFI
jgi:hypothetical protein